MKCPKCNHNLGKGKTYNFEDLGRFSIRKYVCPNCKSSIVINAKTGNIVGR